MPSGAKKRKAAKKKKVHNSSSTNPHQGENGGDELTSPTSQDNQNAQDPSIAVENKEDDSSEIKSKETNADETNIEIETGAKSKSSNGTGSSSNDSSEDESNEKKEVVPEPESAPIESLPPTEPLPEKTTDAAEELQVTSIVEPVDETSETRELLSTVEEPLPETITPDEVDSSLQEVVKVYDETKNEERTELVLPETPEVVEEQIVVSEVAIKDDLPVSSVDESVSKDSEVVELSTPPEGLVSQVHGTNRALAVETDTVEHSDRKVVVASSSIEERKMASWKNCCGILELFSGSER